MKRHALIATLVIAVFALLIIAPTQSTPIEEVTCIAGPDECRAGMTENECDALHEQVEGTIDVPLPDLPAYYPPGTPPEQKQDAYALYCEVGCCTFTLDGEPIEQQEDVSQFACETLSGGTWTRGVCEDITGTACADGETDCWCAGEFIEEGTWCCSGQQTDSPECEVTTPPETPDVDDWEVPDTCGNGLLDYGEQCDGEILGTCTGTAGMPASCTANCRCAYQPGDYDDFDGFCHPGADCITEVICAEENEAPVASARSITATPNAQVQWNINVLEACLDSLQQFSILLDAGDRGVTTIDSLPADAREATFEVIPEASYTITVTAYYADGTVDSEPVTLQAGHEDCFGEQRSRCSDEDQNTRFYCEEDNTRNSQSCGEGLECYATVDDDGVSQAACLPEVDCDECNAAYSNFGEARGSYQVEVEGRGAMTCEQLTYDETATGAVSYCFLDFSTTALKEYRSCSESTACIQYRTQETCEANMCRLRGECVWNEEHNLCTNTHVEFQACESDTQDACEAEGAGCRWTSGECRSHDQICEHYRSQDACIGGGSNFQIDPVTNQRLAESQDELGFGKCVWGIPLDNQGNPLPGEDRCFRDADSDGRSDPPEDASGERINHIFTDPVTSLLVPAETIEWGSTIEIPYGVTAQAPLRGTYTLLQEGDCSTPPRRPDKEADPQERLITYTGLSDGTYCLYYFSQDEARNTERVRSARLTVDTTQLAFENIDFDVRLGPINDDTQTFIVQPFVFLNRAATCNIHLYGPDGRLDQQRIERGTGQQFTFILYDVFPGQYELQSECWLPNGVEITDETPLLLDADDRMTQPIPPRGTYRNQDIDVIGIHTREEASCEIMYGGERIALEPQPYVVLDAPHGSRQPYFPQTAPAPEFLSQTLYELRPTCEFSDFTLSADPADIILFAIDDTPPTTTVTYTDEEGEEQEQSAGEIVVGPQRRTLTPSCEDPEITGRNQQWEAGCNTTYIDTGTGFRPLTGSFTLEPEHTVHLYSTDMLGNQESVRTFTGVDRDVSGPALEQFWIVRDSEGER